MTYGEFMKGCVKGEKDIIFVNVSWGLGIGIIIDGKYIPGKQVFRNCRHPLHASYPARE